MAVKLKGLHNVQRKLNKAIKDIGDVSKEAIQDIALDLQGKSTLLAPVDTGDLRGSAYTSFLELKENYIAEIGFNEPYAVRQHEELEYKHPTGGQAKYLEEPLKENMNQYAEYIRKKAKV